MKKMRKNLAVAVTVALLAFPLNTALTMADTVTPGTTVPTTVSPATTTTEATALELETAVAAYEAGPLTTLTEVATAEGLKAAANTAVATVVDATVKEAFELRVTNRSVVIAAAKTPLQAEVAVAAYEAGPLTTLAEVTTAEGLKTAAVTALSSVSDVTTKAAFELRVTNRAVVIATAKTVTTPVVDGNGNTVTSSNWFTDLIGKLQLALTFDPARKAELNERHALAKLAEAQKLIKDGKSEAAQLCLNEYTDKIAKAQAFLEEIKDPTSETAKTLDKALVNVNTNNILVLSSLLDKLPPQAAQKLALNVVRSMEKAVVKIQKQEATVALETTPSTTPVVDNKDLEKKAKLALANFKKSLNQNGKIHIEDQDQDNQKDNENKNVAVQSKPEQEKPEMEQKSHQATQNKALQVQAVTQNTVTPATVAPVTTKTAPTTVRPSEHGTEDQNKQQAHGNDKQDNHRDGK